MSGGEAFSAAAGERALEEALAALLPAGIRAACRAIRPGDAALLMPQEAISVSARKDRMRDASGAARHVARGLLEREGVSGSPILKTAAGAPLWPNGRVGSLAHDDAYAIAAVASMASFAALGIDVEPAEPLAREVAEIVRIADDVLDGVDVIFAERLLFAAKEAVYKAVFPRDQVVLGFEDVVIDLRKGLGRTSKGRIVELAFCLRPRIVVLAWERA